MNQQQWKLASLLHLVFLVYWIELPLVALQDPAEDDEYGTEWLYYIDDNGTRHVMNFSTLPSDNRGIIFGDVYFHLYTRNNPEAPEELVTPKKDAVMKSKYFNASNKMKFLTHGWMSSDSAEWLQNIKDAYLRRYNHNVITIDWSEISINPAYPWPALSTRYVGRRVAKLLEALVRDYNVKGTDMHLIGHSLGAQVMGNAGMFSNERISRITGLDPARPLFELPQVTANFRLDRSDAEFVDIIHTCAGMLGYARSHGHADFYPNSGQPPQPGCQGLRASLEACSHGRSCLFFGESIVSSVGFYAYPCDSNKDFKSGQCRGNSTLMGDPVSPSSRGDYYLNTQEKSQFARGDDQNNE